METKTNDRTNEMTKLTKEKILSRYEGCSREYMIDWVLFDVFNYLNYCFPDASINLYKKLNKCSFSREES